jgi:hypothetical protein
MAITFDNTVTITRIWRTIGGVGTYITPAAAFDYFPDTGVAANDFIFFGYVSPWHDLTLYVGTAVAASTWTCTWQWYNGSSWQTLTCTDPSNALTTTGTHTITFDVPDGWKTYTQTISSTRYGIGIRLKVDSVSGLTEGGANSGSTPILKEYAIRVTGTGNRLSDILSADTTGGWGMVENVSNCYRILCNLRLGDGSTTTDFTIRRETLEIGTTAAGRTIVATDTATTFNLGVSDASGYQKGASLIIYSPNVWYNYIMATLNCYNSYVAILTHGYDFCPDGVTTIINSVFECTSNNLYFPTGSYALTITNSAFAHSTASASVLIYRAATINNLIFARTGAVLVGVNSVTVENVDFGTAKLFTTSNANVTSTAKNCTFSGTLASQTNPTGSNNKVLVAYTLSLDIRDQDNNALSDCTVTVVDSSTAELFNGTWSTDLVVTVFEDRNTAPDTGYTDFNPITLTISKTGYETYTSTFTLTNTNRRLLIALAPAYPTDAEIAEAVWTYASRSLTG